MSELLEVATGLIDVWSGDPSTKKLWDAGVDAKGIGDLLKSLEDNDILDSAILAAIGSPAAKVQFALRAIKTFQEISQQPATGVLGAEARKLFRKLRGCDLTRSSNTPAPGRAKDSDSIGLLFYTLDDALQQLTVDGIPAKTLVAEAIQAWVVHLDLSFVFVKDASDANIVMQFGGDPSFGQKGGVLGVGTIGGPGKNMQMTLKFDEAEDWDELGPDEFTTTCMHELGHNMGILHPPGPGLLMSAFKDSNIKKPTPGDIKLAQALWGEPQRRPLPKS